MRKQAILFLYRATKCPTEAEKIGFAKHMTHRLWRTKTKSNTTVFQSCTIAANIWENNKKLKRRTHVNINPKTRNRVISLLRDENITALYKKMKVVKQGDKKNDKPITLRSVVFRLCQISGHFGSFPSGFIVANETQRDIWTKRINLINKAPGSCRKLNMQKSSVQVTVHF